MAVGDRSRLLLFLVWRARMAPLKAGLASKAAVAPSVPIPVLGTQTSLQQLLALLGTLAALGLSATEEVRQLAVALPLRVPDVGLKPKNVAETGFCEPDDVVVLVLRSP